jgi:Family of unknown function (DUF6112)
VLSFWTAGISLFTWSVTSFGFLPGDVSLSPNLNGLPGGSELQALTNGLGGWALLLSLVGLLIGAVMWALGSHTQNFHQSYSGRRAVIVSGLAALIIGAGPTLVNFFYHAGTNFH